MDYITRCPACAIAFQVCDDQLQLAAGKVRCGACLTIFDARSYFELPLATPESTPATEDDLLIHDQMDTSLLDLETDSTSKPEPEQPAAEGPQIPEQQPPLSLPPAEERPKLTHQPQEQPEQAPQAITPLGCDSDGSVIEMGCDQQEPEQEYQGEISEQASDEPDLATESIHTESLDDSPFGTPTSKPKRNPLWAIACLLAITLLPLQYAHFNTNSLAKNPQYRPWLETLCQITGCKVPAQTDLSKIKPSHLMVSSHPSQTNALLVEAVIENHADFPQPLPQLLLTFSNLNGQTMAQRQFRPEEYLHGEMQSRTLFPPRRPVRIRLELADPGPDATSYQLLVTK
ncbi:DUF3426 domain-containing protein [Porticoccus sp. GXU_MW_L64]